MKKQKNTLVSLAEQAKKLEKEMNTVFGGSSIFGGTPKTQREAFLDNVTQAITSINNPEELLQAFKIINEASFMHMPGFISSGGIRDGVRKHKIVGNSIVEENITDTTKVMHLIGVFCHAKLEYMKNTDSAQEQVLMKNLKRSFATLVGKLKEDYSDVVVLTKIESNWKAWLSQTHHGMETPTLEPSVETKPQSIHTSHGRSTNAKIDVFNQFQLQIIQEIKDYYPDEIKGSSHLNLKTILKNFLEKNNKTEQCASLLKKLDTAESMIVEGSYRKSDLIYTLEKIKSEWDGVLEEILGADLSGALQERQTREESAPAAETPAMPAPGQGVNYFAFYNDLSKNNKTPARNDTSSLLILQ